MRIHGDSQSEREGPGHARHGDGLLRHACTEGRQERKEHRARQPEGKQRIDRGEPASHKTSAFGDDDIGAHSVPIPTYALVGLLASTGFHDAQQEKHDRH